MTCSQIVKLKKDIYFFTYACSSMHKHAHNFLHDCMKTVEDTSGSNFHFLLGIEGNFTGAVKLMFYLEINKYT